MRGVLAVVVTALVLTACGSQYASTGEEPSGHDARQKALRVELGAQMRDPCFLRPAELEPAQCQKYITQLTSTPEAAEKIARGDPALATAAEELRAGISAYRANGCAIVGGEREQKCTRALTDIAEALRAMAEAVPPASTHEK